ncbi:ubiquitin fusion degradation protein UFD1 family protein [Pelomyxa schiedti]|nr:ubiquitin fusion degradation protein UFD1 family protein [Pelomyxa schiedti]
MLSATARQARGTKGTARRRGPAATRTRRWSPASQASTKGAATQAASPTAQRGVAEAPPRLLVCSSSYEVSCPMRDIFGTLLAFLLELIDFFSCQPNPNRTTKVTRNGSGDKTQKATSVPLALQLRPHGHIHLNHAVSHSLTRHKSPPPHAHTHTPDAPATATTTANSNIAAPTAVTHHPSTHTVLGKDKIVSSHNSSSSPSAARTTTTTAAAAAATATTATAASKPHSNGGSQAANAARDREEDIGRLCSRIEEAAARGDEATRARVASLLRKVLREITASNANPSPNANANPNPNGNVREPATPALATASSNLVVGKEDAERRSDKSKVSSSGEVTCGSGAGCASGTKQHTVLPVVPLADNNRVLVCHEDSVKAPSLVSTTPPSSDSTAKEEEAPTSCSIKVDATIVTQPPQRKQELSAPTHSSAAKISASNSAIKHTSGPVHKAPSSTTTASSRVSALDVNRNAKSSTLTQGPPSLHSDRHSHPRVQGTPSSKQFRLQGSSLPPIPTKSAVLGVHSPIPLANTSTKITPPNLSNLPIATKPATTPLQSVHLLTHSTHKSHFGVTPPTTLPPSQKSTQRIEMVRRPLPTSPLYPYSTSLQATNLGYGMLPVYPQRYTPPQPSLSLTLTCHSLAVISKEDYESGGKIFLPQKMLDPEKTSISCPLMYEVRANRRLIHCGVLEFTAPDGCCYMPFWMMKMLHVDEGDTVDVNTIQGLEKGKLVKLGPSSADFFRRVENPKALLEQCLHKFSALTKGEIFPITTPRGTVYTMEVLELQPNNPSGGISVIDTDIEVEFSPTRCEDAEADKGKPQPLPASEPNSETAANATRADVTPHVTDVVNCSDKAEPHVATPATEPQKFVPFSGTGYRLSD